MAPRIEKITLGKSTTLTRVFKDKYSRIIKTSGSIYKTINGNMTKINRK